MGVLLVAALLGLGALLMPGNADAAEAKPKPKGSKAKPKSKKRASGKRPKVKGTSRSA